MDRHGNGSNSKKHSPRTARHDASGWHDPMVGPGLGCTLDTVARHGHVTIFGWSARRPVNSPQIRRISTKENPNSLLLPLPQTPPPPSLPPSRTPQPRPSLLDPRSALPSHTAAGTSTTAAPSSLPQSSPRTPAALRWAHTGTTVGRRSPLRPGSAAGRRDLLHCGQVPSEAAGSAPPRGGASPSEKS
jgi:hypothetical protein